MMHHPIAFANGIITKTNKYFTYDGPLFSLEFVAPAFLQDVSGHLRTLIMAPLFWIGIGLAYFTLLIFIANIAQLALGRKSIEEIRQFFINPIFLLSGGYGLSNLLFCIGTCCENSRHFWMASAYLIPVLLFYLSQSKRITQLFSREAR